MTSPKIFEAAGAEGEPFEVTDEGEGATILLVHGGSSSPDDWKRVAGHLATSHRVLRYTRFTYRVHPPPPASKAMAGEIHDVLTIADAIGAPIVALGHSSGAVVILESALARPERFAGILLYEPPVAVSGPLGGEPLRRAREAIDAGDADRAVRIFFREIAEMPGFVVGALRLIRPIWRRLRAYAPAQIADTEAIERLGVGVDRYKDLPVPVLLLAGGALSPSHLDNRMNALAKALPNVESRVTMRFHGHGAHVSSPRRVARVIAEFADRVAARSSGPPSGAA